MFAQKAKLTYPLLASSHTPAMKNTKKYHKNKTIYIKITHIIHIYTHYTLKPFTEKIGKYLRINNLHQYSIEDNQIKIFKLRIVAADY